MKLIVILLFAFNISCLGIQAQTSNFANGFGFGYHIQQIQDDFGIGLHLISPYMAHNKIAIRIKGNLMFNESLVDGATEWIPYSNFSFGLIGVGGLVNDHIRLYGEGGLMVLLPPDKISTRSSEFGGYGLFGFEFFFSNHGNYYIEIGGVGTGAKADVIENTPIYSNGLIISAGLRFFLK